MIASRKEQAYAIYARALFDNGKTADADRLIEAGIAAIGPNPKHGDNLRSLYITKAKIRSESGDLDGALAVLQDAEAHLQADRAMQRPNILANRAQMLADGGRYAQAAEQLAALDAWAPDHNRVKGMVSGAQRQIEALRACIGAGLGQSVQAEASFTALAKGVKTPDDAYARAALCAGYTSRIADVFLMEGSQPLSLPAPLLRLQPAFKSHPGATALPLGAMDPRLQQFYLTTMRDLPPSLTPALSHWR